MSWHPQPRKSSLRVKVTAIILIIAAVAVFAGICALGLALEEAEQSVERAIPTHIPAPRVAHLTPDEFEEAARTYNVSVQNIAELKYWQESDIHWDNLDAIRLATIEISTDRVTSRDEYMLTCQVIPQWFGYVKDSEEYIREYRKALPKDIVDDPRALALERENARTRQFLVDYSELCAETHDIDYGKWE